MLECRDAATSNRGGGGGPADSNPVQQLADLALRLRNQFIDRQLAALAQRGEQPETGEAERVELLRKREALRLLKRQPLTEINHAAGEPF